MAVVHEILHGTARPQCTSSERLQACRLCFEYTPLHAETGITSQHSSCRDDDPVRGQVVTPSRLDRLCLELQTQPAVQISGTPKAFFLWLAVLGLHSV